MFLDRTTIGFGALGVNKVLETVCWSSTSEVNLEKEKIGQDNEGLRHAADSLQTRQYRQQPHTWKLMALPCFHCSHESSFM